MVVTGASAQGKCDYCSDKPATLSALCRGATGRVCEVMWICVDCDGGEKDRPTADDVRDNVVAHFGAGAFADF